MRFLKIRPDDLARWQPGLEALEHFSVYPLGTDTFQVHHGASYLAFFERMGDVHYYALEEGGELIAVGCGVLRSDGGLRRWYIGDLKVHRDHRKRHLPLTLFQRAFFQNWLRCPRGYAIAMNPADERVPQSVRMMKHFRWLPPSVVHTEQLDIYSGDAAQTRDAARVMSAVHGLRPHYASLLGVKDLVLGSTGKPLELLHMRFADAKDARVFSDPQKGCTHMWCAPRAAPVTAKLLAAGFTPTASATIIHHRMARFDWSSVDTSEI